MGKRQVLCGLKAPVSLSFVYVFLFYFLIVFFPFLFTRFDSIKIIHVDGLLHDMISIRVKPSLPFFPSRQTNNHYMEVKPKEDQEDIGAFDDREDNENEILDEEARLEQEEEEEDEEDDEEKETTEYVGEAGELGYKFSLSQDTNTMRYMTPRRLYLNDTHIELQEETGSEILLIDRDPSIMKKEGEPFPLLMNKYKISVTSTLNSIVNMEKVNNKLNEAEKYLQSKSRLEFNSALKGKKRVLDIQGILGVFDLPNGPYLAVITETDDSLSVETSKVLPPPSITGSLTLTGQRKEGSPNQEQKYQLEEKKVGNEGKKLEIDFRLITKIVLIRIVNKELSEEDEIEEMKSLSLLRRAFRSHELYFSNRIDVTKTLQRQYIEKNDVDYHSDGDSKIQNTLYSFNKSLTKQKTISPKANRNDEALKLNGEVNFLSRVHTVDKRFFWNQDLLAPFSKIDAESWITPVMNAYLRTIHQIPVPRLPRTKERDQIVFKKDEKENTKEPMIDGRRKENNMEKDYISMLLISRRSCKRQGQRFLKRGIDKDGNVANFVETEQIVLYPDRAIHNKNVNESKHRNNKLEMLRQIKNKGKQTKKQANERAKLLLESYRYMTSFVQIRGSIPLYWQSPPSFQYHPTVTLKGSLYDNVLSYSKHTKEIISIYGDQGISLINLIDKKKEQQFLGSAFDLVNNILLSETDLLTRTIENEEQGEEDSMKLLKSRQIPILKEINYTNLPKTIYKDEIMKERLCSRPLVEHVWFDFHANTKKMRYQNLADLVEKLHINMRRYGYFSYDNNDGGSGGVALSLQNGVMRTNCMDCLDRTNVVQTILARYILLSQLISFYEFDKPCDLNLSSIKSDPIKNAVRPTLPIAMVSPASPLSLRACLIASIYATNHLKKKSSKTEINNNIFHPTNSYRKEVIEEKLFLNSTVSGLPYVSVETACRTLWAGNADFISVLYSGTPALKGDFTRTGKRTSMGMLMDGLHSTRRYVINNFVDFLNQKAVNTLLGTAEEEKKRGRSSKERKLGNVNDEEGPGFTQDSEDVDNEEDNNTAIGYDYSREEKDDIKDTIWEQPLTDLVKRLLQ